MSSIYDRVLITGGAGMLAQAIERLLKSRGCNVRAPGHADLDISDHVNVGRVFIEFRPTLVINCGAFTKVDQCEDEWAAAEAVNIVGVGNVANFSAIHGAKLLHFSTDFVFDGTSSRPYDETELTCPLSAYGRSKLGGERWIQAVDNLNYMIIRTAWLYGPGGACFPQTILNAARQGRPLTVVNDQVGCPTFTRDLSDATLRLIDAGASGSFHVVNSGQTTWYEFAIAILDEFGVNADLKPISSEEWKKLRPNSATRPAYSVLDTSKYTHLAGHRMRDWREALHDYRLSLSE